MPLYELDGTWPTVVHREAFVAPTATLTGDVHRAGVSEVSP